MNRYSHLPSKSILIVGPAWVGDMIMAQTLFKLIKNREPEKKIHVLAPPATISLLQRMPEVDNAIAIDTAHGRLSLGTRFQTARLLKVKHYDQAILLTNSWKSALIPFLAKIPKRTGWRGEFRYGLVNDMRLLDKKLYPLMIQQFAMLALHSKEKLPAELPFPKLSISLENQQILKDKFGFCSEKPLLILAPGAEYGPAKRWPTRYFAEVARQKILDSWQVAILGSFKEIELANEIVTSCKEAINLVGKTQLVDAIDILAMATAVVTNDSGLMHITAALDRPLVAIYGSSTPHFTPPLSNLAKILSLQLPCSPCFKRECPLGHLHCLNELTPDRILKAL